VARIGYARVSSVGQSLAVQLDKLTACDCDKIYQEKKSGATGKRSSLEACLDYDAEAGLPHLESDGLSLPGNRWS